LAYDKIWLFFSCLKSKHFFLFNYVPHLFLLTCVKFHRKKIDNNYILTHICDKWYWSKHSFTGGTGAHREDYTIFNFCIIFQIENSLKLKLLWNISIIVCMANISMANGHRSDNKSVSHWIMFDYFFHVWKVNIFFFLIMFLIYSCSHV
jgi:hypothetical protein